MVRYPPSVKRRGAPWQALTSMLLLSLCALSAVGLPVARAQSASDVSTAAKATGSSSAGQGSKSTNRAPSARDKAREAARKATAAAGAAAAAAAAVLSLSDADDDQRQAYSMTHLGEHECEFRREVRLTAHPTHEGYVDLHFDKRVVTTKPVLSSTGAIRLEDVRGQFLLVQIAFKSMLLDTLSGRRVADECVHDKHREARRAAEHTPPQPGLGIAGPATSTPTR